VLDQGDPRLRIRGNVTSAADGSESPQLSKTMGLRGPPEGLDVSALTGLVRDGCELRRSGPKGPKTEHCHEHRPAPRRSTAELGAAAVRCVRGGDSNSRPPGNTPTRAGREPAVAAAFEGSRPRHVAIMTGRKRQNTDVRGVADAREPDQAIAARGHRATGEMP
jgi:hypothetical protein